MKLNHSNIFATALATALVTAASPAVADQAAAAEEPAVTLDLEVDPIAYAASGYSLHAGLSHGRYRLDLGAFAADLPEFMHGNDGFDVAMNGFGVKLDAFWRDDRTGPFAGVDAGLIDLQVVDRATSMVERTTRFQAGVRVGWRISLPADFYASPWIGVGYATGAGDRTIAGREYQDSPIVVFPTIHLGRTFR